MQTDDNNDFYAGIDREDITPPVGTLLYGYTPDTVSNSVHDPLYASAIAFSQNGSAAIILVATVGDIQNGLSDRIRAEVAEEAHVSRDRVILCATHTHSAPNVAGMEGWGDIDREYTENIFIPQLKLAARKALASMQTAEIAVGTAESRVGINRRQQNRNGSISLGQNPWGCFDPTMTVISIRNAQTKKNIVNIIHYGCHGTAAGRNFEITRDWSGIMEDRLAAETGTPSVFVNGSQGDVGPRLSNGFTTGDIRHVEELGGVAAADAIRAYKALGVYKPGRLGIVSGIVRIPRKVLPPERLVDEKLASYAEPEKLINIFRLEYAYYKAVKDEYASGAPVSDADAALELRQTVISLGDVAFVPFPFEIFAETSLRLRAYSHVRYTLVLSNANGYMAYLPVESELCRGGYEVDCFRFSGAHPLADNADQIILDENLKLIDQLQDR